MGNLPRCTAEFHANVEGGRADPDCSSVVHLFSPPKADVMALFRTAANRLFKSQVFLAPEEIKTAYGSFVVRSSKYRIDPDSHAAPESQWSGRIPARRGEGTDDIFFQSLISPWCAPAATRRSSRADQNISHCGPRSPCWNSKEALSDSLSRRSIFHGQRDAIRLTNELVVSNFTRPLRSRTLSLGSKNMKFEPDRIFRRAVAAAPLSFRGKKRAGRRTGQIPVNPYDLASVGVNSDRFQKHVIVDWFEKKSNCSGIDRFAADRRIVVAREDNHPG